MSMTHKWTANPSVVLPTAGRALGMPACASIDTTRVSIASQGKTAGRERVASYVGGATPTMDAFPGTPVWRPPIC